MRISEIERRKFEQEEWRVETTHAITQEAITSYLSAQGDTTTSAGKFFYSGKEHDGYTVPFKVVEYLAKNRAQNSYDFTAYHKPSRTGPWVIWKEGMKTPNQKIRQLNHLFGKGGASPKSLKMKRRAR